VFRARYPDVWPSNYKLGMWVWVLHRLTALFLIGYVFFHLLEIGLSHFGADVFDKLFGWGYSWWMQTFDLLLMAALLYHGMNGLRIILLDLGVGVRRHKLVFAAVMLVALVIYYLLAVDILPYIIGRPLF